MSDEELRLPEGWTSAVVHLHSFWWVYLSRNGCSRASLSAPDRATAIRAAKKAVEEMEGGSDER